jgi:ABC-type polysaccharide/polyol phosphate transport system ATPase subunit
VAHAGGDAVTDVVPDVASEPAVLIEDVRLGYRLSRNSGSSLKEFAISLFKRQVSYETLWALNGVNLQVHPGEVVAVIGANGAGKSTLMKLIARVLPPNSGRIRVRGRIAPMIELGAGFNPDLTGIENIVLYGTLLGRHPRHMRHRAAAIAEWADLSDYLDVPVRSYSSGMLARLAFSVAVDTEPDVLIVDEVLSVGDEAFQRRSLARIEEMINRGTAVILVTHSMAQVLERATRAVWLERGRVRMEGQPAPVVTAYRAAS